MGFLFERKVSKAGGSRTTRTLNKKTGKYTSTTTSIKAKPKAKAKKK
jgi:hypothetical protein